MPLFSQRASEPSLQAAGEANGGFVGCINNQLCRIWWKFGLFDLCSSKWVDAANGGPLEGPWDTFTCEFAAYNGYLDCLKYAHENGCSWDERTCSSAAKDGHSDCLKYEHLNSCPWNKYTCIFATDAEHGLRGRRLALLKLYFIEN